MYFCIIVSEPEMDKSAEFVSWPLEKQSRIFVKYFLSGTASMDISVYDHRPFEDFQ